MSEARRSGKKNKVLKVVILGDGGVGKSCLMNRFVANDFEEHSFHTIGVEFRNKDIQVNGNFYTLQIWDTAGQERFKSLRTPFYRGTDICLLTYAIDDKMSFDSLKMWLGEFKSYADVSCNNEGFPYIVVGNKSDISPRDVTMEQLADWCSQHSISCFIETSAKTASNVTEAFDMAIHRWLALEKMVERDQRALENSDSLVLTQNRSSENNRKMTCCRGGRKNNNNVR